MAFIGSHRWYASLVFQKFGWATFLQARRERKCSNLPATSKPVQTKDFQCVVRVKALW